MPALFGSELCMTGSILFRGSRVCLFYLNLELDIRFWLLPWCWSLNPDFLPMWGLDCATEVTGWPISLRAPRIILLESTLPLSVIVCKFSYCESSLISKMEGFMPCETLPDFWLNLFGLGSIRFGSKYDMADWLDWLVVFPARCSFYSFIFLKKFDSLFFMSKWCVWLEYLESGLVNWVRSWSWCTLCQVLSSSIWARPVRALLKERLLIYLEVFSMVSVFCILPSWFAFRFFIFLIIWRGDLSLANPLGCPFLALKLSCSRIYSSKGFSTYKMSSR